MRVRDPNTLRIARQAKGLSQRQMATEVGCSQATLSLIERGQMHTCTDQLAEKIARALGVERRLLFDRRRCSCNARRHEAAA